MARGKRTRLSTGIYKDPSGIVLRISVNGTPVDLRRARDTKADDGRILERGASYATLYKQHGLSWLRQERARRQAAALLTADVKEAEQNLFPADVDRFLATISSEGHRLNTQGYMKHWLTHFEDKTRNEITDVDAQTAFAQIKKEPSTKIHIRRALIQFYETLNGKSGYNPGRAVKKPAKPDEPVRDLPWATIEQMLNALPPSRAKARLMVIAYTGLPHKQIAAIQPSHLRLEQREFVAHPRRKGAGVAGRVQPLSDFGIAAFKEFIAQNAFGSFQNRQLVETFKSAAKRAGVTLPAKARPYDLRHSFLTELARGGADIRDIAHLGMHATLEQAARYIKGAASERATNALQAVPRFRATSARGKRPKVPTTVHQRGTARARNTAKKHGPKSRKRKGVH